VRAPALDEELELDECEDDGLEELNATGRLTLAEIAQAALDAELEENDFDGQTVSKMREPAPEPTEPAPPQPSEPSEPAPEPEQPEPAPPAPQSAPMEPTYFPLQPELAALWGCQSERRLTLTNGLNCCWSTNSNSPNEVEEKGDGRIIKEIEAREGATSGLVGAGLAVGRSFESQEMLLTG
jgi:hypothetical protein